MPMPRISRRFLSISRRFSHEFQGADLFYLYDVVRHQSMAAHDEVQGILALSDAASPHHKHTDAHDLHKTPWTMPVGASFSSRKRVIRSMKTELTSLVRSRGMPLSSASLRRYSGTFRFLVTMKHATSLAAQFLDDPFSLFRLQLPQVGDFGIAENLHPVGVKIDHVARYYQAELLNPRIIDPLRDAGEPEMTSSSRPYSLSSAISWTVIPFIHQISCPLRQYPRRGPSPCPARPGASETKDPSISLKSGITFGCGAPRNLPGQVARKRCGRVFRPPHRTPHPPFDLPKAHSMRSMPFIFPCGMAMPSPMPVLPSLSLSRMTLHGLFHVSK